mmetsp:Transcript_8082/g.18917  ORF Transcript_8082/g.18917 Transcript_8082/m.18917 type:complete len:265 (-) Transcript_8082:1245-2039(-)
MANVCCHLPVDAQQVSNAINVLLLNFCRLDIDCENAAFASTICLFVELQASARIGQDEPEILNCLVPASRLDGYRNLVVHLALFKLDLAFNGPVVSIGLGCVILCLVLAAWTCTKTSLALDKDLNDQIFQALLNRQVLLLEHDSARPIIVKDEYSSGLDLAQMDINFLAFRTSHILRFLKIQKELFILLLALIIQDLNSDQLLKFAWFKGELLVNPYKVFASLGIAISRLHCHNDRPFQENVWRYVKNDGNLNLAIALHDHVRL